ncbi:unnamed protein product [Peniophora sp. CBMAI 1063]|nr:unnamed protein product [Peniophora sp. CBMAI 1063]
MAHKAFSSHVFNDRSYTVKHRFKQHPRANGIFCFSHTLRPANASPRARPVALVSGYVILRDRLAASRRWYAEMFVPSRVTAELSLLFDARGRLLAEHLSSLYLRNNTVWGHELSEGNLLLVTELRVVESHRRQGIAAWLLDLVLSEPTIARPPQADWRIMHPPPEKCEFAIASPCGPREEGTSEEQRKEQSQAAERTFQRVGFRRIGRSAFLAKPLRDLSHPALRLPARDDARELSPPVPSRPLPVLSPFMRTLSRPNWPDNWQRLPLHGMISSQDCSDAEILAALSRLSSSAELAHLCTPDPLAMNATPLHLAAMQGRASVLEKLLTTDARGNVFAATAQGRLPLDCLQRAMREEKASVAALGLREWPGYSVSAIQAQAILLAAMGKPIPSEVAARWGCTCGRCAKGWFSPAMSYQMSVHAEVAATSIRLSLASTPADETRGRIRLYKTSTLDLIHFMNYIPTSIREPGLQATFIEGYAAVLQATASLTRQKIVPSVEVVSEHALRQGGEHFSASAVEFFIQKGGTIEHALNGVLHTAWEQGPGGDGTLLMVDSHADELRSLPACDNDEDYHLLRANLKIPVTLNGRLSSGWLDQYLVAEPSRDGEESAESSQDEI